MRAGSSSFLYKGYVLALATFAFTLATSDHARIVQAEAMPAAVEVGFVGDLSFAGRRDPPAGVLADVRSLLSSPDLTLVNVEGLFLAAPAPAYREARLEITASPHYAAALAGAGVDLIGTANNHAWDAGAAGVTEHLAHLAPLAIPTFGSSVTEDAAYAPRREASAVGCLSFIPATLKSNRPARPGAHIAFYGPRAPRPLDALTTLVTAERAAGCAPIVYVHWGREARPSPDASVVTTGHALVDAGAALVVGHHPHVLQGASWRGDGAIAWSLGNFVFTNRDPDKRRSGVLVASFTPGARDEPPRLAALALAPVTIDRRTLRPRPATTREARDHLTTLGARSRPFGTSVHLDARGLLVFEPPR